MSDILDLADRLGKELAASPQARKLAAARAELEKHPPLVQLFRDYQQHAEKVARLEEENQPIEVPDKHRLDDLRRQLLSNDVFKTLTAAQVDFVDLMRRVHQAMNKHLHEGQPAKA